MNEVVKYHNDLNGVNLKGWSKEDMNFFFAIISKVRDHSCNEVIEFSKDELIPLTGYNQKSNARLIKITAGLIDKIHVLSYVEKTKNSITWMSLFTRAKIEWNEEKTDFKAYFKISEDFEYILNKLDANFTKFELAEFVELRSTYAKQAYRLLKQWKTVGKLKIPSEQFKYLFSVPKSYASCDITRNIITPIQKELPKYFPGLKVTTVKAARRGSPVVAYEFTWTPEKTLGPYEPGKPKTKRKSQKASLPEWYYKEDPGKADAATVDELKALLERPVQEPEQPSAPDSNNESFFDPLGDI